MPVQVIVDNQGSDTFEIQPSNTFLVDNDNHVWPVLDSELAYQRLSSKTDLANIAAGSVKPAILGAAVGTVVGAAAGAVLGGAGEIVSKTAEQQISEDLYSKGLETRQ